MAGVLDKPITPCVGICSTTSQGDAVCRGCRRTFLEVKDWNQYSERKKLHIMDRLKAETKSLEDTLPE